MECEAGWDLFWADWDDDGVSSVVSASTASANVDVGSEDIDELALALVAPLGTKDDGDYMRGKTDRYSINCNKLLPGEGFLTTHGGQNPG